MIGIYKITNPKGKVYIGQSVNIKRRLREYKAINCKQQSKIYNSLMKYGVKNHTFEILTTCEINNLNDLERYYQEIYNCIGKSGLNCKLVETEMQGAKYSIESRNKMSESAKNKIFTEKHRLNMSINRQGEKNGMYGKKQSESAKLKMSEAKKNLSLDVIKKYSDYAKNRTEEHRRKLSEAHKGQISAKRILVLNLENGIFYNSIKEAEQSYNIKEGYLKQKLSGYRKNNTPFIKA